MSSTRRITTEIHTSNGIKANKTVSKRSLRSGEQGKRYLITYSRRPINLLYGLRKAWEEEKKEQHAEATGLVLGQLASWPQWTATYFLDEILRFVRSNGPMGVEGSLFTAMTIAQRINRTGYEAALGECSSYKHRGELPYKEDMGIYLLDLGFSIPRLQSEGVEQPFDPHRVADTRAGYEEDRAARWGVSSFLGVGFMDSLRRDVLGPEGSIDTAADDPLGLFMGLKFVGSMDRLGLESGPTTFAAAACTVVSAAISGGPWGTKQGALAEVREGGFSARTILCGAATDDDTDSGDDTDAGDDGKDKKTKSAKVLDSVLGIMADTGTTYKVVGQRAQGWGAFTEAIRAAGPAAKAINAAKVPWSKGKTGDWVVPPGDPRIGITDKPDTITTVTTTTPDPDAGTGSVPRDPLVPHVEPREREWIDPKTFVMTSRLEVLGAEGTFMVTLSQHEQLAQAAVIGNIYGNINWGPEDDGPSGTTSGGSTGDLPDADEKLGPDPPKPVE